MHSAATTTDSTDSVIIDIAGHQVPVVAGGLYDRFHSNPPLDVIAEEDPTLDLSWFKTLTKTRVDMGFESYSPNFYYRNSRVTMVFTADLDALKAQMPAEVLEQVQPLQIWPGRGLIALTAYAYHYCDNDSYNEIALSIVTNKPGSANMGPFSLIGQSMDSNMWGYVLKLPVDTEVARVRGVVGYNLPKWLTRIDYRESVDALTFDVYDSETGKLDFTIQADRLDDVSTVPTLTTTSFTNLDHDGKLVWGHAVSRQMVSASSSDAEDAKLTLGDGSFSEFIRALDPGRMIQYEYVPEFQSALYAPEPLSTLLKQ
ncbi:acetoacetate decarboxylase (ADC) [Halopseudomonas maritima]|nr:acetoacetate decarboxylase (ADC) [Halopseudomonas maritima]